MIGLSVPSLPRLHPGAEVDPDSAGLVARHAAALRRDGVHAYLGAGDVSLAQVLRLTPLSGGRSAWGGQLVAASLAAAEAEALLAAHMDAEAVPGVVARRAGRPGQVTVALAPYDAVAASPALDWQPIAATWRDALLAAR